MILAIVGSRTCSNYERVKRIVDSVHTPITGIVSGGARGADTLAEAYAIERDIPIEIIRPDWDRYGKSAGIRRNADIVERADAMIAFWDGRSRGTANSIERAKRKGIPIHIVRI
jgi:hypothetical protein